MESDEQRRANKNRGTSGTCRARQGVPLAHGDRGRGRPFSGCGTKEVAEANPTVTVMVDGAEKGPIQRKVVTDAVLYPRDQAAIVPKVVSSD